MKAQPSAIDLKTAPLPLVMFGSKCRFRPIALEALQKMGRTYDVVFVAGSLESIQIAVKVDLGISVLTSLSIGKGMVVLENEPALPSLPAADLALYSRKNGINPMLSRFLIESVAAWEKTNMDGRNSERRLLTSAVNGKSFDNKRARKPLAS